MPKITRISRSDSWRQEFIAKHRGRCHYCNRTGALDRGPDDRAWWIDHMDPISRGGADTEENLTLACKRCNLAKGVQPYSRFKEFAEKHFWAPDDWRASEYDLDRLMELRQNVDSLRTFHMSFADLSWHLNYSDDKAGIVLIGAHEHNGTFTERILSLDGSLAEYRTSDYHKTAGRDGNAVLALVIEMYRLMPAMVAELRLLRGEESNTEDEAA